MSIATLNLQRSNVLLAEVIQRLIKAQKVTFLKVKDYWWAPETIQCIMETSTKIFCRDRQHNNLHSTSHRWWSLQRLSPSAPEFQTLTWSNSSELKSSTQRRSFLSQSSQKASQMTCCSSKTLTRLRIDLSKKISWRSKKDLNKISYLMTMRWPTLISIRTSTQRHRISTSKTQVLLVMASYIKSHKYSRTMRSGRLRTTLDGSLSMISSQFTRLRKQEDKMRMVHIWIIWQAVKSVVSLLSSEQLHPRITQSWISTMQSSPEETRCPRIVINIMSSRSVIFKWKTSLMDSNLGLNCSRTLWRRAETWCEKPRKPSICQGIAG